MDTKMRTKVVFLLVSSMLMASFFTAFIMHSARQIPAVANDPVYEKATLWCMTRIDELPPGDSNRKFFELALRDIIDRNIRWDIEKPNGLHYTLLVSFATAWDNRSNQIAHN